MECENCKQNAKVSKCFSGVVEKKCKILNCEKRIGHHHNLCNSCGSKFGPNGKSFR